MNAKKEKLLHALLDEDAASTRRSTIIAAGNMVLRRKRRLRTLQRTGVTLTLLISFFGALFFLQRPHPTPTQKAALPSLPIVSVPPAKIEIHEMTDDELLANFPGVPVGLVKADGQTRLFFARPEDEARFILRAEERLEVE